MFISLPKSGSATTSAEVRVRTDFSDSAGEGGAIREAVAVGVLSAVDSS